MGLLTKVLEVNGERSEEFYDGLVGMIYLFPRGTTRTVRTYFLIPRKIDGKYIKGKCTLEQVADIESTHGTDANVHYNTWRNSKILSN